MKKEHIKEPYLNGESYEQAVVRTHEFYRELIERLSDAEPFPCWFSSDGL